MSIGEFKQKWREIRLRRWIMRCILAEAFFIALVPEIAAVALIIGSILTLVKLKTVTHAKLRPLPLDVPLLMFIVLAGLSVFRSPDQAFSFYNYSHLVGAYGLTYFLVGQNICKTYQVKKIAIVMATAAGIVVLYGFYQFIFGINTGDMRWTDGEAFPDISYRIYSTWENPNILAGYLDVMIAMALGFLTFAVNRTQRMLIALVICLFAACLAMTYARGAMLTLGLLLLLYGIYKDWRVPAVGVLAATAALAYDPALAERLTSIVSSAQDTSGEMRWAFWEATWAMIQDHPFLGIGWGAYWLVYPEYDFYMQGAKIIIYHAHNIYLNYAAEVGIPGAMAFFWFFFGTMSLAFKTKLIDEPVKQDMITISGTLTEMLKDVWGEVTSEKNAGSEAAVMLAPKNSPDGEDDKKKSLEGEKRQSQKRRFKIYKLVKMTPLVAPRSVNTEMTTITAEMNEKLPEETETEPTGVELLKKISAELRAEAEEKNRKQIEEKDSEILEADESHEDNSKSWKFYLNELTDFEPLRVCAAMSLGTGLAIFGMALNGFTDDLLFNFPSSLLLWFLAALAAVNADIVDEQTATERNEAWL